ncbi:MAG: hypothetical protein NPIRA01_29050 [Nitrospirales bacterium]|nr:MAG: hypothetical protein NPIRA01_29050 [Nitrospirales bacterium]
MKRVAMSVVVLILGLGSWTGWAMTAAEKPFVSNIDSQTGDIHVPEGYTLWPVLGTWSHAKTEGDSGIQEHHVVYTQPETIQHYQQTGEFPDGAVLVKELLNTKTMAMTTGPAVGHATTVKGWFVLIRDTKGRFPSSSLWGDGWGWSFFDAEDSMHTESKDYKTDCIPCHTPARQLAPKEAVDSDKWIYSFGYPVLQNK